MSDEAEPTPAPAADPAGVTARINKIAAQRDEAIALAETHRTAAEAAASGTAAQAAALAAAEAQVAALKTGRAEDLQLVGLGLTDPSAFDVARLMHARLPEDGRPDLATYVGGVMAAPDSAPWIKGYLRSAPTAAPVTAAPAPEVAAPAAAPGKPLPPASSGVVPPVHASGLLDVAGTHSKMAAATTWGEAKTAAAELQRQIARDLGIVTS